MHKGKSVAEYDLEEGYFYYAQQGSCIVGIYQKGDELPEGAAYYVVENAWERDVEIPMKYRKALLHETDLVDVVDNGARETGTVRLLKRAEIDVYSGEVEVYAVRLKYGPDELMRVADPKYPKKKKETVKVKKDRPMTGFKFD